MTKKKIIEIEEYPGQGEDDMSINELMRQEYGTWDEHDADYYDNKTSKLYKKKLNKIKKAAYGGLMKKTKPINMATGGLMNKPLGYKSEDKQDSGISPYDVDSPKSTRAGMPSRLLGKDRTRFKHGGFHSKAEVKKYLDNVDNQDELKKMKEALDIDSFKKSLLDYYERKEDSKKPKKEKSIAVSTGGLLRKKYGRAGEVKHGELDTIDEDTWEFMTDESDIAQNKNIDALIEKEEIRKEMAKAQGDDTSAIDRNIVALKAKKNKKVVAAALGGYMDENDIAEQTPLALSIGGQAALDEKYDRRKDYKAYAEGDEVIAEEEEIIEDPLMAPSGMNFDTPALEEDALAETDMEMAAEDAIETDSVLDTSMLSDEEEAVVDQAIDAFPELEAIIPKIAATEFTEDELVEGPGTGTSDSIPALLSDGEFVFTAKAVKHLGIDKLRKMMKQAEEAYDAGIVEQEDNATMAAEEDSLLV